jgi:hypothetical protein
MSIETHKTQASSDSKSTNKPAPYGLPALRSLERRRAQLLLLLPIAAGGNFQKLFVQPGNGIEP